MIKSDMKEIMEEECEDIKYSVSIINGFVLMRKNVYGLKRL